MDKEKKNEVIIQDDSCADEEDSSLNGDQNDNEETDDLSQSDNEDHEVKLSSIKNKLKYKKAIRNLSAACYYNSFKEVKATIAKFCPAEEWIDNQIPKGELTNSKDSAESKTTCLCIACRYSSIRIVKELVKCGARVDTQNSSGNTPLHRACRSDVDTLEKVIFLLKLDAVQLKITNSGKTPLHVACRFASVEVVRELVSNGAKIGLRDSNSDLPIHTAAESEIDRKEKLDFFLERRRDFINIPTLGARTLLHIASDVHTVDRVQELVDLGSNVDVSDQFGNTALHKACSSKVDTMQKVRLLTSMNKGLIQKANKRDSTPLHIACQEGTFEVMKYLIENDADGNALDDDKDMAVARACMSEIDREEKVAYLVQHYSNQIRVKNRYGNQPIHLAVWFGYNDAIQILINGNADVNARGDRDRTPLHMAAERGHPKTVQLLLNNGGDKNATSKILVDFTPLHSCANLGNLDCVQVLLDNDADANLRDARGNTALHHAAFFEKIDTVKVLAKTDTCNIRIKNNKGNLAIQYAETYDYNDDYIEKRDIEQLHSIYGVLRKLDIDWKKAEALAGSVSHHSVLLTKDLLAEDHVDFLHNRCILTRKEKKMIDETVGSENKIRTLLYTLMDKEDAYWAPFFLQSLKNTPRAASCAVIVEATAERPTFYRSAPPPLVQKTPVSDDN